MRHTKQGSPPETERGLQYLLRRTWKMRTSRPVLTLFGTQYSGRNPKILSSGHHPSLAPRRRRRILVSTRRQISTSTGSRPASSRLPLCLPPAPPSSLLWLPRNHDPWNPTEPHPARGSNRCHHDVRCGGTSRLLPPLDAPTPYSVDGPDSLLPSGNYRLGRAVRPTEFEISVHASGVRGGFGR
jgi:hypothetical protein